LWVRGRAKLYCVGPLSKLTVRLFVNDILVGQLINGSDKGPTIDEQPGRSVGSGNRY
jgi:hypothetical protein